MKKNLHIDCSKYIPVDVFKGICHDSKEIVMADIEGCDLHDRGRKCRYCKNYTPTEDYLGICCGKTIAYPDLSAKTCEDFRWKKLKE